jgi:hypothetical protein
MRITYILTLISIFSDDDSSDEDNSSVEMEHVHKKNLGHFLCYHHHRMMQ